LSLGLSIDEKLALEQRHRQRQADRGKQAGYEKYVSITGIKGFWLRINMNARKCCSISASKIMHLLFRNQG
jgi:hypothetical protein